MLGSRERYCALRQYIMTRARCNLAYTLRDRQLMAADATKRAMK